MADTIPALLELIVQQGQRLEGVNKHEIRAFGKGQNGSNGIDAAMRKTGWHEFRELPER